MPTSGGVSSAHRSACHQHSLAPHFSPPQTNRRGASDACQPTVETTAPVNGGTSSFVLTRRSRRQLFQEQEENLQLAAWVNVTLRHRPLDFASLLTDCNLYTALFILLAGNNDTLHTNPKRKRGKALRSSLTLRVSVKAGR